MSLGWMKTILKLTALSLIVGLVMAAFDVRPTEVLSAVGNAANDVFRGIMSAFQWAWRYIVLGAVVVVPFWLILCLFRWRRLTNDSPDGTGLPTQGSEKILRRAGG